MRRIETPWLSPREPRRDPHLKLFCFPYAGGSALAYRHWEGRLPACVELHPVHLPGRGRRRTEPPFRAARACARAAAAALLPLLDEPFALFGHSMGALIAFELALLLDRDHKRTPEFLIVSAREAPDSPRREPPAHLLPDPELMLTLRDFNGTPRELLDNAEAMSLVLPLLRADFELAYAYVYADSPPLPCPIRAVAGREDATAPIEKMKDWAARTRGGFSAHAIPGDHFSMLHARPLLDLVADQCLAAMSTSVQLPIKADSAVNAQPKGVRS